MTLRGCVGPKTNPQAYIPITETIRVIVVVVVVPWPPETGLKGYLGKRWNFPDKFGTAWDFGIILRSGGVQGRELRATGGDRF